MRKVIIIGGGIGGLTLARACLEVGLAVELYEKRPLEAMLAGPGGIFLQLNALRVYRVLDRPGLYDRFYQQGGAIRAGGFFSRKGEPLYINRPQFVEAADLGVCLLRSALQTILYEALPAGVVHPDHAFENFAVRGDRLEVTFKNGHRTEGDVLVGADGLYSLVRAQLEHHDRPAPPIYSGMTCWRGYFEQGDLPLDPQYSWGEYWGRGDRFGYFDVGGGRFSFYGFANSDPGGQDGDRAGQVLQKRFGGYGSPIPDIVAALGDRPIYRDDIYDRLPLGKTWGQGPVTLIGDAAHPVQPNLGQGGCMAIEDAFELAKTLRRGGDPVSPLRQFEAERSDRVARVFRVSRQVGQLGQAENPLACFLRNGLYKLLPPALGDRQFRWLFDYHPQW